MKYLLDTHCWLWWILEPENLGSKFKQIIGDPKNQIFLSAASTWEATIKAAMGRLSLPGGPKQFVEDTYSQDGFLALPILPEHSVGVFDLPPLHKDPFDRLLIAQALYEGATLCTVDPLVRQYSVPILNASL